MRHLQSRELFCCMYIESEMINFGRRNFANSNFNSQKFKNATVVKFQNRDVSPEEQKLIFRANDYDLRSQIWHIYTTQRILEYLMGLVMFVGVAHHFVDRCVKPETADTKRGCGGGARASRPGACPSEASLSAHPRAFDQILICECDTRPSCMEG